VNVLLGNAARLSIGDSEQAILKVAAQHRGKDVATLALEQRASLEALLSRLQVARGHDRDDLLVAVAARSLAIQLAYWDDDMRGRYGARRDAGMANVARFLVSQSGVKRACLWAHDGHITKEGDSATLGQHLASDPALRYYGIGFYLYQGSTRAWDGGGKIGVISHAISAAPPFTIEGAVMQLTGMPETAWLPLRNFPAPLQRWLDKPRFVREVGHTYFDEDTAMMLRRIARSFDAVVVLKTVHDSSPTPTGIRTAKHD
jgi:erythromycin esterase-like protein